MSQAIVPSPINRIRDFVYEPAQQTGTEPIADQELGYWIRANAMHTAGAFPSSAEFLWEQITCPFSTSKTARSFVLDREFLQDACGAIRKHFDQMFGQEPDESGAGTSLKTGKAFGQVFASFSSMKSEELAFLVLALPHKTCRTKGKYWDDVFKRLSSFSELQRGWNGYSAPPPSRAAIVNAREFLNVLFAAEFMPSRVRPSSIGGVGVTFRKGEHKVYVEFVNDGRTHVLYSDGVGEPVVSEITGDYRGYLVLLGDIRKYLNG